MIVAFGELHASGFQLGKIQHTVDDGKKGFTRALNILCVLHDFLIVVRMKNHIGKSKHGIHRGPDFVTHICKKSGFCPVCLNCLRPGRFKSLQRIHKTFVIGIFNRKIPKKNSHRGPERRKGNLSVGKRLQEYCNQCRPDCKIHGQTDTLVHKIHIYKKKEGCGNQKINGRDIAHCKIKRTSNPCAGNRVITANNFREHIYKHENRISPENESVHPAQPFFPVILPVYKIRQIGGV